MAVSVATPPNSEPTGDSLARAPPVSLAPQLSQPEYLVSSSNLVAGQQSSGPDLSFAALSPVLQQALLLWTTAGGNSALTSRLSNIQIRIADLPDGALGQADGNVITLSSNAAGHGWFIDETPADSTEFGIAQTRQMLIADAGSRAFGRMDLLTVLLHEMGHVLGLGHDSNVAVMRDSLDAGTRVLLGSNVLLVRQDGTVAGALTGSGSTLSAEATDTGPITFTITSTDGNSVLDVIVSGASTGNATYVDVSTITGSNSFGDSIVIGIDQHTTWNLTGMNSGSVTVDGYSAIQFSQVENLTGALSAADSFIFDDSGFVTGAVDDRGGVAGLDMGTGSLLAIVNDLSVGQGTMDVVTGNAALGTLASASVMKFSLSTADLFVGSGGALNAAGNGITTAGAVGLFASGSTLAANWVRTSAGNASYLGATVTVINAALLGVSSVDLQVSGTVSLNKASVGGVVSSDRIDWTVATDTTNTNNALGLLTTLAITSDQELHVVASGSLNILGNLVAVLPAAGLTLDIATMDVVTGNANITTLGTIPGTIDGANVLSFSLTNASLFVGVGGALDGTRSGVVSTGATGFLVSGASLSLDLVSKGTSSFLGATVTVSNAALLGVSSVDLQVSGTVSLNKASVNGAVSANRIDWTVATNSANNPQTLLTALAITSAQELHVVGSASLNILDMVVGRADISFDTQTVNVDQNGNGVFSLVDKDLKDATLMTIGLSNLSAFVGVGGSLDSSRALVVTDAIGFSVTGGSLGLAIIKANAVSIPGDNRSYIATTALIQQASFVGLPSDISIRAADISVDINNASGTVPLSAPAQLPAAIDWIRALDLNGDGQFNDSIAVGGRTIALTTGFTGVSGKLGLSAFGVVQVFAAFDMSIRTVDLDLNGDGQINPVGGPFVDLHNAQMLTFDMQLLPMVYSPATAATYDALKPLSIFGTPDLPGFFVGVPGSVGFQVNAGHLVLSSIKAHIDPTLSFDPTRSFTMLQAKLQGIQFVGIPASLNLGIPDLDFSFNGVSSSLPGFAGVTLPSLDWTQSINLNPGIGSLGSLGSFAISPIVIGGLPITLTGFDTGLSINGSITLNLFGSVLAYGHFDFNQLSGVSASDGSIALTNASGMHLSLSQLQFFVGVNGDFVKDAANQVTALDTSRAIGFSASDATLDLWILKEGGTGGRAWTAVSATIGAMAVHGLPGDVVLEVLNLSLAYNAAAADGSKLDWAALSGLSAAPLGSNVGSLAALVRSTNLAITGTLYLDVSGFVVALASFSIDQQSGVALNDGKGVVIGATPGANVLVIHLSGAYFFAGAGGAIQKTGYSAGGFAADLVNMGAVGFYASGASLDLAIVGEGAGITARKWIGVGAHIAQLGVVGLPDGFALSVRDLDFFYNLAARDGKRMDWKGLSTSGFGLSLGSLARFDNAVEFQVSGMALVSIANFVTISGSVALQRKELFVKTVGASSTTKMSVLTLGASDMRAFVGTGNADSNNDGLVDDAATLALNGVGVTVAIDQMVIVLAKPLVAVGSPASTKSYFALSASGSAALIGVDGVALSGRLSIAINQGKDGTTPSAAIDFAASATSNPDAWGSVLGLDAPTGPLASQHLVVDFAQSNLLRVSGYVSLSIADFLHLSGEFSFSQSGNALTVPIAGGGSKQVNVMTIGASNVNAFVGNGAPY